MSHAKLLGCLSTFLVVVICNTSSLAQTSPGTDSAFAFYPLNTGDVHEFHFYYAHCARSRINPTDSFYCVERVMGDTLLSTGHFYKAIESNVPDLFQLGVHYLRIDSTSANVYGYDDNYSPAKEVLFDSLRATAHSQFVSYRGLTFCGSSDTMSFLSVQTISKRLDVDGPLGGTYRLAYGLGKIQDDRLNPWGCDENGDYYYMDLVYANIGGKEYGTLVSVREKPDFLPRSFALDQNFPNPFNPSTSISYSIRKHSHVRLQIFNPPGQLIATLVDQEKSPGTYTITWDASTRSTGLYFYRLTAGEFVQTKKAVLIR